MISVIVPIYNVYNYLEKCLNSIINQTYKNLEIILIDDGSTDGCGKMCDNYKELDNRIVVVHQKNCGLSNARNKGIEIAKGNLISFVDGDDYLELNMFDELKKNMDKYNSDISIGHYYYLKNDKRIIREKIKKLSFVSTGYNKFCNIQNEYENLTVFSWGKIYKREIFNNIRYPEGRIYEDSYIICNVLKEANRVSYLIKPLYNYCYRSDSIVNTFDINHFDKIDANNKKIVFFLKNDYLDLALKEKNKKMNNIIINLSKMKSYRIKNKKVFNKYYKELLDTNKEVKWKDASKKVKLFKIFRRPYISVLAIMYRVKDLIKK